MTGGATAPAVDGALSLAGVRDRRILVAGASGFIGSHLCRRLVAAGAEVHGASRRAPRVDGIVWHRADLTSYEETAAAVAAARPDVVFQLAGVVAGSRDLALVVPTFHANLASSVYLLAAAVEHGVRRVVVGGSMEEPDPAAGEDVPTSPYAAAKWAATGYGRMFDALYGLEVVNLRVFVVYGPDQPDRRKVLPYVIHAALAGQVPELASGTRRIDWVYVDDAVDALVRAAVAPDAPGGPIDVGSGTLTSVRDIVERAVRIADPDAAVRFGAVGDRPLEVERAADLEPARRRLGWTPTTDLDTGLRQTVAWYAAELAVAGGQARDGERA